jgi:hypothetical protein
MLLFSGEKSGQVMVRTPEGKNPSQMRVGRRSATRISRSELQRFKLHSDCRSKKRTGFGSHPEAQNPQPDVVEASAPGVTSAVRYS